MDQIRTQNLELKTPAVSVLMPTYDHARFIRRAIESMLAQILPDWELRIVDDGSPDDTHSGVAPYLNDPRVHYRRLKSNLGLGAALNQAVELARGCYIAYLLSDDAFFQEHLQSLVEVLGRQSEAVVAFSGVRYYFNKPATGKIDDYSLQLVQVLHRRTKDRWLEGGELVTDDLERMFWVRLRARRVYRHWPGDMRVGRPPGTAPQAAARAIRRAQPLPGALWRARPADWAAPVGDGRAGPARHPRALLR
jgi:glycosyltransferase involved in cell wall biosynthesis